MNLNLPKKRLVVVPASNLKRVLSYLVDFAFLSFILTPLASLSQKMMPQTDFSQIMQAVQNNPEVMSLAIANSIATGLIILAYFTLFEYSMQQTPGNLLLRIRVVGEGKKQPGFWNCLVSNLTFIPVFPFIILWLIDPIHMMISKEHQRFMEKIAKVFVVEQIEV